MSLAQLNQCHKGIFKSPYHDVSLRYNHNVWRGFTQQDGFDYTLWGIINQSSGSSLILQIEDEGDEDEGDEESLSQAIFEMYREKLAEKDPNIKLVSTQPFGFRNIAFKSAYYTYQNPQHGAQIVLYAFNFYKNFTYTLILTWPEAECEDSVFYMPLKHKLLLEGLHVDQEHSLRAKMSS